MNKMENISVIVHVKARSIMCGKQTCEVYVKQTYETVKKGGQESSHETSYVTLRNLVLIRWDATEGLKGVT